MPIGDLFVVLNPAADHGRAARARPELELLLHRAVDIARVPRCAAEAGPEGAWHFTNGLGLGFDARVAVLAARSRTDRCCWRPSPTGPATGEASGSRPGARPDVLLADQRSLPRVLA